MRWLLALFCLLVGSFASVADGFGASGFVQFTVHAPAPPPTNPTFVALHTYFISPTGNDSNNGLTTGTAWATPNHSGLVCGDAIIAITGAYTAQDSWGTVSNCPSTTGGIDGTGGIYFVTLFCGGTLDSCTSAGSGGLAFRVNASNWAVEGFPVNSSGAQRAFEANGCAPGNGGPGMIHHVAFINDISANNLQATDTNDCGGAVSTSVPSAIGVDYFATVGVIAQNSAQDGICLAAIDVVGPGILDTNAGTHYFIYGNFSYANHNTSCVATSDTESFMADTWDAHGVSTQGIFANNIGYDSDRMCVQVFSQNLETPLPTIKIYNNTCYQDNQFNGTDFSDGEVNLNLQNDWHVTVVNNLLQSNPATSTEGNAIYPLLTGGSTTPNVTIGGSGTQNFVWGVSPNTNCIAFNGNSCGTNTNSTPSFTNVTDLISNQVGVPSCSGFENTTQCMGWNATTSTLTTPSIISDLVPTAGGTAGKGYQLPSITCVANADYPMWLKGIVYLHWNGSTITENPGLVTKPCGL